MIEGILSGNIFSESFLPEAKNFSFQKGDYFKKTSVMKRIVWAKKKRYKYFLFGMPQIQNKIQKNVHYLFAEETKKAKNVFSSNSFFNSAKASSIGCFLSAGILSPYSFN